MILKKSYFDAFSVYEFNHYELISESVKSVTKKNCKFKNKLSYLFIYLLTYLFIFDDFQRKVIQLIYIIFSWKNKFFKSGINEKNTSFIYKNMHIFTRTVHTKKCTPEELHIYRTYAYTVLFFYTPRAVFLNNRSSNIKIFSSQQDLLVILFIIIR